MIKKITALILSLSLSLCSTAAFSFTDNKDIKEDTLYENMMKQKKSTIIELEDLSIKELIKLRDKALDENLSMSSYDMSYRKEGILDPNWDFGLVGFLNNNYGELTEKENLIKQIQLIEYATLYKDVLDPSGEVFKVLNEDYQISEYLIKHGKTYEVSTQENLEFLIENIEDVVDYVDFDAKTVVEIIDPTIKGSFISNDEIRDLNKQLKEKSFEKDLDNTIKKDIQSFVDETQDINELSIDSDSEKLQRDSFTSSVLSYARKHGYTNGYNFSYAAHSDYDKRTNLLAKLDNKKISYYKVNW